MRILDNDKEISIGNISLKAGATEQLGQVGRTWNAITGLFTLLFGIQISETHKEAWGTAISEDNPERSSAGIRAAAVAIYKEAENLIGQRLAGDNDEAEADFLNQFAAGLRFQAVLEEGGVELIHLSDRSFKVLIDGCNGGLEEDCESEECFANPVTVSYF